jgi:DNA mismatch repair ATPase MutS
MSITHQLNYYSEKILVFNTQIALSKNKTNLIFYSRLVLFVFAFVCFLYCIEIHPTLAFMTAAITVVVFLFLLRLEIGINRKIIFLENLIRIHQQEIELCSANYEKQDQGTEFIDKAHPFIGDLDIFGRKSIFQLLNRTTTFSGRIKLADWLTNPLTLANDIEQRQEAVSMLREKPEWCCEFMALGLSSKEEATDKDVIKDWLNEDNQFSTFMLKSITIVLPILTVGALVLSFLTLIPTSVFTFLFFVQLTIVAFHTKVISHIHNRLSRKFDSIEKYRTLIAHIEKEDLGAEILQQLKNNFNDANTPASESIHILKKRVDSLDARMNIVVAVVLNGLFLWDIRVMQQIEKWRMQHKEQFAQWIDSIGSLDAFISVAMYSYNHPQYAFPEVERVGDFVLEGQDLGHPMIGTSQLVTNNYSIQGIPKVDLLTGANMAGKSTFLRAVGTNLILAMIGAPVCASRFRFTPILLFTSLRTNDSLQENESFFYAELKRLQQLILHYQRGEKVFFLLDEILKGTNSKDQHLGAKALIEKIIKLNGTGIIATHDVELSQLAERYPENISNLCFEIAIENDKLIFDYKIKDGVCRTMNASFLLKKMEITD